MLFRSVFKAHDCGDGNECTDDSCDPVKGCLHAPHSCDDANICTNDLCDPTPGKGCYYQMAAPGTACDDSSVCTQDDSCVLGKCLGTAIDCDDGVKCTSDLCDAKKGCVHVIDADCACNQDSQCDDGNESTCDCCCHTGGGPSSPHHCRNQDLPGNWCNCDWMPGC